MSRSLSLTARTHAEAQFSGEVEVVLLEVTHPDWELPWRLSTDPTERLSTDPLRYGTRSTWRGANPMTEPFEFVVASMELPGDQEDAAAEIRIIADLFDSEMVSVLRGVTTRATAHLAVVLASQPSVVEVEYTGLEVTAAEYADALVVSASRKPIEEEGVPMHRMTKERFPGMFR